MMIGSVGRAGCLQHTTRVSCIEEANDGGSQDSEADEPDSWRVLPMLAPPWFYHDLGVVFIVEMGGWLLFSQGFFDLGDDRLSWTFLSGVRLFYGVVGVPLDQWGTFPDSVFSFGKPYFCPFLLCSHVLCFWDFFHDYTSAYCLVS